MGSVSKECTGCRVVKPVTEFHRKGERYRAKCKGCRRNRKRTQGEMERLHAKWLAIKADPVRHEEHKNWLRAYMRSRRQTPESLLRERELRRKRLSSDEARAQRKVVNSLPSSLASKRAYNKRAYADPVKRERMLARKAVWHAVRTGKLTREPCACGETATQGHHHNGYSKEHRLDVVWMCRRCHDALHYEEETARITAQASERKERRRAGGR